MYISQERKLGKIINSFTALNTDLLEIGMFLAVDTSVLVDFTLLSSIRKRGNQCLDYTDLNCTLIIIV